MCNNTEDNGFGEETERFFSPANALTFAGLTAAFATHPEPPGVYALFGNTLIYSARYGMRPAGAPAFAAVTGVVAQSELAASDAGRLTWEKLADLATITSSTVQYVQRSYYYDKRGRLRQQAESGPLASTLRTSLRYDYVGNETDRTVTGTLGSTAMVQRTATFDERNRLLTESASLGSSSTMVKHGYDAIGRHLCDTLTATGAAGIVTDTYDIRSQLLTRTAKKSSTTLFEETLRYDSPTRGTAARYAGGLSEVMTLQGSTRNTYGFIYDAAGRLMTTTRFTGTNGTSGSAAYTERNLTYNRNGALLTLKRYGSGTSTAQDDYSYTYSGPLLTGVSGKDDGSNINASFSHDGNGNTTADGRANLTFTYNLLNLPETVTSGNTQTATYHWLSDGTKYKVTDPAGNGVIYAGDLTYAVTVSGGNTTYALESAEASADGTARFLKNGTAMTPYYTIRDHIGSVRTIVNASGTVVERNDYYPFGSRTTFGASYATLSSNRQKFSGKEDQTTVVGSTLPYLDFGARMYDAKLVRWNTFDPMAEKYYGINPYVYCAGDPVNHIDPKGQSLIGWLLAYKAVAAGMEHFGRTSDTKTIGFGMQRPITALRVGFSSAKHNNISSISTRFASEITISAQMDNSPTLSPGNALRYVIWQALITREFGNNTAKRIGNAHEERSKDAEYQADTFVDQKNNVIGRLIGDDSKNSSNVEIVLKVLEYYRDIGLWISIKQQDGTYKNEQSRMTEEQFKLAVDRLQKLNEDARENNH